MNVIADTVKRKKSNSDSGTPITQDVVRDYQLREIQSKFKYVKENSRFYKEHFKDVSKIETWDDFYDLPFTYPEDIKHKPYDFLCVGQRDVERIVTFTTSGTTGIKKRIFFTAGDMEKTVDFFHYGMMFFTRPGDNVMILMPGETPGSVGDLLSKGLMRFEAKPYVYGIPAESSKAAEFMLKNEINVAVSLPMDMYNIACSPLADEIKKQGKLTGVLLSADFVMPGISEEIGKRLGCKVYEHYGMTETCFGGGVFCEEMDGYHLREGDMFFEIVDMKTGEKCQNGEYGEVVVTTFSHEAMPLFRYRTGDIARFKKTECRCGYKIPVMERVLCRKTDMISLTKTDSVSLPEIETAVLQCCGYDEIQVKFSEKEKRLEIGIFKPELDIKLAEKRFNLSYIGEKLAGHGIKTEFDSAPRPEKDLRGMTKRGIIRI